MSEDALLKESILGGYKKEDVIKYIDSISEANNKKAKDMKDQIVFLKEENDKFKEQLVEDKKQLKYSEDNIQTVSADLHEDKRTSYMLHNTGDFKNQERLSIRQQMELPEGTYVVSKGHDIVNLPDPFPAYHTKKKSSAKTEGKPLNRTVTKNENISENIYENEIDEIAAAELSENNKSTQDIVRTESMNDPLLSKNIKELQDELLSVKALLKKEKTENQILAAKLEFCNDLLLKLYNK